MCARYPESEFIFPDIRYVKQLKTWEEKKAAGTRSINSLEPTRFTNTSTLAEAVWNYCRKTEFTRFTPRDLRRTFKTLGGQIKISKEVRDRIQNHSLNDISSKHYDRYDYFEEKIDGVMKWENKLLELLNKI